MKNLKLFENFLNETISKTVYRRGSEFGDSFDKRVTFFTDSKEGASSYGKPGDKFYTKEITFNKPLILKKGKKDLRDKMVDIFGEKGIPDIYYMPFSLNDDHRKKIIDYAIKNKYDGIILSDTDFEFKKVITSYIILKK